MNPPGHYHCPRSCEHPQPFDLDGKMACGRCYVYGEVVEMVPCGEQCERGTVGQQIVTRLRDFAERLERGEPIEVTQVRQEHIPDGPLTTRKKGEMKR